MVFVRHAARCPWRAALSTVLVAVVVAPATAVGPALPQAPRQTESSTAAARAGAVLAGVVLDGDTRGPIAGALVVATNEATGWQQVATSGPDGRYEIGGLAEASYSLRASALGYIGRRFGQRYALDAGVTVDLSAGDVFGDVDFALRRGATIRGRVLDATGAPMELIEVEALRPQLRGSQRVLMPISSAQSSANGTYTITGLPPGDYYVGAFDPAAEGALDETGVPDHTFHPDVPTPGDATRVGLIRNGSVTGIHITMQTVSTARVSGRLTVAEGIELQSGVVALSPESSDGANIGTVLGALATPDGVFTFPSVRPGTYRVRAQASATGVAGRLFGSFVVTVEQTDLFNLVLSLSPGALLEGRIELEPRGGTPVPADLSGFIVSAPMADGTLTRGTTSAPTRPDGTFLFDSPPGPRVIRIGALPPPWVLDRVLYQGRDVIDVALDFTQGASIRELRVILTDQSSRLTGLVTNDAGDPVTDRAVVVVSRNPFLRFAGSRHVQLTYPDLNGRYDIAGLPTGSYLVALVEELYPGELSGRADFDAVASAGMEAVIEAGTTTTLDLKVDADAERLARVPSLPLRSRPRSAD